MEGKVVDEDLLVSAPRNINEEISIDGGMVVCVKMISSVFEREDASYL